MSRESDLKHCINELERENKSLRERINKIQANTLKYINENRELRKKLGLRVTGPNNKPLNPVSR